MAEETGQAHSIRRALRRAEQGRVLSRDEATALLAARGDDLERLCAAARSVREAAHGSVVSFSKKVFIPLTRLCRDRCAYCTFATTPDRTPAFLTPEEVVAIARAGAAAGCKEALFTLGDRPEARYPEAREWLAARGYASTLDYLRAAAIRVIEETGLLPHLNPGVMSYEEMARLKPVAASMGLMLETSSERLFTTPGLAHHGSPDKRPAVRLRCIEDAGRLAIPFTTGILIGIGETPEERVASLFDIRERARRFGHVQEVIVQNFRAKPETGMAAHPEPSEDDFAATIAVARLVIEPRVSVQAPPNLSDGRFPRLLDAGIDDWGGVSPVTPDHVNPEKPWPHLDALERATRERGLALRERLCVYPSYALRKDPWLSGRMVAPVEALRADDGYAAAVAPRPVPWQDPDAEQVPPPVLPPPLRTGLRADSTIVHGDWDALEVGASRAWAVRGRP
ncbi:MAG: 7,8-didemethyl-8-hydroxy-5-deazariboflavin synthase CofG, partial [Actinomycetota bacterium]